MADNERTPEPPFLKRWSQRKLAASREPATPSGTVAPNAANAPSVAAACGPARRLPPLPRPPRRRCRRSTRCRSTPISRAFLQPKVDESLKRQALRKLFADPRFNVMDGLDVYIDDYSKFEPIPPELVAQLNQAKFLFDPPKTRVNEQGHVEDVPDERAAEAEYRDGRAMRPLRTAPASRSLTTQRMRRPRRRPPAGRCRRRRPPKQTR